MDVDDTSKLPEITPLDHKKNATKKKKVGDPEKAALRKEAAKQKRAQIVARKKQEAMDLKNELEKLRRDNEELADLKRRREEADIIARAEQKAAEEASAHRAREEQIRKSTEYDSLMPRVEMMEKALNEKERRLLEMEHAITSKKEADLEMVKRNQEYWAMKNQIHSRTQPKEYDDYEYGYVPPPPAQTPRHRGFQDKIRFY